MNELVVAIAQLRTDVGDIEGNTSLISRCIVEAEELGAHVVVFPELCVTGYPPEDLLLKEGFVSASNSAAGKLAEAVGDIVAVVGYVEYEHDIYNSAAVMHDGRLICSYRKRFLPTSGVFDEKRYFGEGTKSVVLDLNGVRVGLTICEDIWFTGGTMLEEISRGGAEVVLNISASPFNRGKQKAREDIVEARAVDGDVVLVYSNSIGAQDELVFDGGSCVCHPLFGFLARAGRFTEEMLLCPIDLKTLKGNRLLEPRHRYGAASAGVKDPALYNVALGPRRAEPEPGSARMAGELSREEEVVEALSMGLSDYVRKNGFQKVVLGLSGGIDSAVTAAIAVQALGCENVICVFMPSQFTSEVSRTCALELAGNMGVEVITVPIDGILDAWSGPLDGLVEVGEGVAWENLQARIRGNILMALSNEHGWLVLATGNKSEMSMGYCTLYGDMAGGFALIKDLLKTQVYETAEYLNAVAGRDIIPRLVIEREPTAELKAGQKDSDALPPYEELDPVLDAYVEGGLGEEEIMELGFAPELVRRVIRSVDTNEYKRRQAPVGVKITPRAFGRDWRMPISIIDGW